MRRGNIENRQIQLGEGIYYGGGHLHVTDEKGSYSVPVGRKARRTLCVIQEEPGRWKRCIEIDLITGNIYLTVDHADDAANVYYYDSASEKLWNERLLRILRTAARAGMVLDDALRKVVVKLPCPEWQELLRTLPGWEDELAHRLDNILLPQGEVEIIRFSGQEGKAGAEAMNPERTADVEGVAAIGPKEPAMLDIEKVQEKLGKDFTLRQHGGRWELHYANQEAGGEFFGSEAEFLRFLSGPELLWVARQADGSEEGTARVIRFLWREIELV